jgi:hypothetical protein
LIQSIGDNEGIVYIALQDNEGIYSASKDVDELSSFQKMNTSGKHLSPTVLKQAVNLQK